MSRSTKRSFELLPTQAFVCSYQSSRFPDDNFTIPMILYYLNDKDVLQSFLLCCRALKSSINNYSVKSSINVNKINNIIRPNKYINCCIVDIKYVTEFNQLVDLPESVRKLTFGNRFNQSLPTYNIPSLLKQLKFGSHFNQPLAIGSIPLFVTHLTFGEEFNQPFTVEVIPSVTQLKFGSWFSQPLDDGVIPSSVIHLQFGEFFFNYICIERFKDLVDW